MKSWKGLINNTEANELFEILQKIRSGERTDENKQRILDLADLLNNRGYPDGTIEQFIDWKELNDGLHNAINSVLNYS